MSDLIDRQQAIDKLRNNLAYMQAFGADRAVTLIEELPSAQPETHEERTEMHACDLISKQAAIDALMAWEEYSVWDGECLKHRGEPFWVAPSDVIKQLSSAQPERLKVLANVLDGCPLTYPCDTLWSGEEWCRQHCKPGQDAADAECWLRYAEVVANG